VVVDSQISQAPDETAEIAVSEMALMTVMAVVALM
jgi:hypothetical protein